MSLHSVIKRIFIVLVLLLSFESLAQEETLEPKDETATKASIFSSKERQTFITLSHGFNQPISSGDNFIGNGLEGKGGIAFNFQLYVYKQFTIGFAANSNYFEVKDQSVVGNYKKTTINEFFLNVGYEFLPIDKLRFGIVASVYGTARYKNKYYSRPNQTYQLDHGYIGSYGFSIKYELNRIVMLYADYAYSTGKTDIDLPNELESVFRKGTYHNIGIGLAFNIGKRDLISRFKS